MAGETFLGKKVSLVKEVGSGSRGGGEWRESAEAEKRSLEESLGGLLKAEVRQPEQALVTGEGLVARPRVSTERH